MSIPWINIDNAATDGELVAFINEVKERYPEDPGVAAELSNILAASGTQIPLQGGFPADVASTGGPTSLSTLICPLFLRAAGALVPKLGVPGRPAGGIDCLAQIPGFRSVMNLIEIEQGLAETGYVHFLGGQEFTPLDTRLFRLRQQNSAQEVPTLVVASLMAKKLAVGVRHAGLDIRVAPHGNFGRDWTSATQNARLFIEVGQLLGIQAAPVLTDARFPYQPYVGRKEALLALRNLFDGAPSSWLEEHYRLCRTLASASLPSTIRPNLSTISSGDLESIFRKNVIAQGGDIEALSSMLRGVEAAHSHQILATEDGFAHFDLQAIRKTLVEVQNACTTPNLPFPDPVGVILTRHPGDWVRRGELLGTVRIEDVSKEGVLEQLGRDMIGVTSLPLSTNVEGIEL